MSQTSKINLNQINLNQIFNGKLNSNKNNQNSINNNSNSSKKSKNQSIKRSLSEPRITSKSSSVSRSSNISKKLSKKLSKNIRNLIPVYKSQRNDANLINTISDRFENTLPKDFLKNSDELYTFFSKFNNDVFVDLPNLKYKLNNIIQSIVSKPEYYQNISDTKVLSTSDKSGSGSVVLSFIFKNKRYIMKISKPSFTIEKENYINYLTRKKNNLSIDRLTDKIFDIKFNHITVEYKIYKYLSKFINMSINPFIMQGYDLYKLYNNTMNLQSLHKSKSQLKLLNIYLNSFYNNKSQLILMINETSKSKNLITLHDLFKKMAGKLYEYLISMQQNYKTDILNCFNILRFINEIIYFQLLYCLSCFEKIKLKHNDLHFNNILVILKDNNLFNKLEHIDDFKRYYVEDGKFKNWYLFKINGKEYSIPDIGIEIRIFDFDRSVLNNFNKDNYMNNNKKLYNTTGIITRKQKLYDEYYDFFTDNDGFDYVFYNGNEHYFEHQLTYTSDFYNSTDLNKIIYSFMNHKINIYKAFHEVINRYNTSYPRNKIVFNINDVNIIENVQNFVYNKKFSDFDTINYLIINNIVLDALIADNIFSLNDNNNIFINNSNKSNMRKFRKFINNNKINYTKPIKNIDCRYNKNTVLSILLIFVIKNINERVILPPNTKEIKIKLNIGKYNIDTHYGFIEDSDNYILNNLYLSMIEIDNSDQISTTEIIIDNVYDLIKKSDNIILSIFSVLHNLITSKFNISVITTIKSYIADNLNHFENDIYNNNLKYYCSNSHLICDYKYKLTLNHFGKLNSIENGKIFNTTLNTFQYYLDTFYDQMLDTFLNLLDINNTYDFNDILALKGNGQLLGYFNFDSIDKVYFSKKTRSSKTKTPRS